MRPVRQETVERLLPESFGHRGRETASVGLQGRAGWVSLRGNRGAANIRPVRLQNVRRKERARRRLACDSGNLPRFPHRDGDRTCRFGLFVGRGLSGARPEYMPFSARPRPDDGDGNAGASGDCFRDGRRNFLRASRIRAGRVLRRSVGKRRRRGRGVPPKGFLYGENGFPDGRIAENALSLSA